MSSTVVRTDRSHLTLHPVPEEWLVQLADVVEEIQSLLDYHPPVMIYGKQCHQQRSVSFFSDQSIGYRYSGQLARSKPLTPSLRSLLEHVNTYFHASFNGILVNKYENGEEYISKHSDDEHALDRQAGVVCLSFGAVRKFRIRRKSDASLVVDIPTESSRMIQMAGEFQKEFTHEIPVEKRVNDPRYSFTFRAHTE